jgi:hypothetical protein
VRLGAIAIRLDSLSGTPPDSCQAKLTIFDSTSSVQAAFQLLLPDRIIFDAQGKSYEIHLQIEKQDTVEAYVAIDSSRAKSPKCAVTFQNYPNPFNPVTTITYDLPEQSHVRISVFNLLGSEIAVLVDGQQPPGTHHVEFDGTMFPNSVYFYEVRAGNFIGLKKMLLLK